MRNWKGAVQDRTGGQDSLIGFDGTSLFNIVVCKAVHYNEKTLVWEHISYSTSKKGLKKNFPFNNN